MAETLVPLKIPPGLRNNGTRYESKGRWFDGNLVRFFEGMKMPVGGWVARELTGDTVEGEVRGLAQWTPEVIGVAQKPVLALGTTAGLFIVVEDEVFDVTPDGFTADTGLVWTLEPFGSYLTAVAHCPSDYTKTQGPFVWAGDTNVIAVPIENAPASPTSIVATDERFFVMLGGVDALSPNFGNYPTVPSTRTVLWPSQETLSDWTPTAENSAGSQPLATEGSLLAGRRVRGQTLLWTTTDLHTMTYIGGEFVFRFQRVGDQCGAISVRSPIITDTAAFWMGPKGFFAYDGFVKPVPCDVLDYVFGSFNRELAYLVWGYSNPAFGEVTWHYPSAEATTLDRYVTFNYRENHWTTGALPRMAGVSSQPPGTVPVLVDKDGVIYDHETGTSRLVGGVTSYPYLESGPFEIGEGDRVMQVDAIVPDEKTLGQVEARLITSMYPMAAETTNGPYTLAAKTDVRLTARIVRLRLTEVSPSDWRVGTVRLGVKPGGRR